MLKLKLQYFGHLMQRADSLEKTLMLGKIEGKERRGQQRIRWFGWDLWLNRHEFEQTLGDSEGQGSLQAWKLYRRAVVHGVTKSQTWLSHWTATKFKRKWSKQKKRERENFPQGIFWQPCARNVYQDFSEHFFFPGSMSCSCWNAGVKTGLSGKASATLTIKWP